MRTSIKTSTLPLLAAFALAGCGGDGRGDGSIEPRQSALARSRDIAALPSCDAVVARAESAAVEEVGDGRLVVWIGDAATRSRYCQGPAEAALRVTLPAPRPRFSPSLISGSDPMPAQDPTGGEQGDDHSDPMPAKPGAAAGSDPMPATVYIPIVTTTTTESHDP